MFSGFAHDHLCKRVVPHQALVALHLAARMWLLASDCEVVHRPCDRVAPHPSALGNSRLCHFMAIWATGERDTLNCRVPVSTKPIIASAPTSMQIVINRPLRSLIASTKNSPARNGEPHENKEKRFIVDRLRTSESVGLPVLFSG